MVSQLKWLVVMYCTGTSPTIATCLYPFVFPFVDAIANYSKKWFDIFKWADVATWTEQSEDLGRQKTKCHESSKKRIICRGRSFLAPMLNAFNESTPLNHPRFSSLQTQTVDVRIVSNNYRKENALLTCDHKQIVGTRSVQYCVLPASLHHSPRCGPLLREGLIYAIRDPYISW